MADTPKAEDTQDAMRKQIAELRREMNKINKTLAERAEEVAEQASGWYDAASDRASRAARQLRSGAQSVSETVQQNPGTVSTALVLGGVVGFMIGMLVSQSSSYDRRWY
ncbi:hypothetical protein [Mesorhizobium sp. SP-1A]|uniref:hypothetical protein n=1 Tax=Mesorhizobium sp. SP-1A TaxID=3077840 RepID=UPI0028F70E79|nr:hypothetical protein [Mesorhizobium sp. SP-1A]